MSTDSVSTGKGPASGTEWISQETILLTNKATAYQSPTTGLRGLVVSTGEPLCSLHIAIATCATTNDYSHKDDGLPHTLEHAIFLGSEQFSYKGILDKLANRSLADGTNAWTATDHTAYTLTTAGQEGALNLLPVYADHILYPTLTNESFHTEVHHVTPEGTDKGVVYCEMQGRENSDGSLVDRAILDLLYPNNCGYSAETGGKMKKLRSLTNQQVQRYHAENYTPDNVMFVLSGNVDADAFFEKLDQVEQRIVSKGATNKREERPWVNHPIPDLDMDAVGIMPAPFSNDPNNANPKEISFPSEDESRGTISIAWRGPRYEERETWVRLLLLWDYLTDSAASPLQKAFVECDDPVCAGVGPAHEIFTVGYQQLWFTEVDVNKMDAIAPKLFKTLLESKDSFDLDRMRMVIRRKRRRLLEFNERRPTDAMIDAVIRNFLYAPRDEGPVQEMKDLEADVDELPLLLNALTVEESVWLQLLDDYILSQPYALVLGRPSAELATKMAEDEKAREAQQAKDLGPEKLKELGEQLKAAIDYNEREIPEQVLTSIPIPSLDKVKAVPVLTIRGAGESVNVATNSGRGVPTKDVERVLSQLRASASKVKDAEAYYVDWGHIESAFLYTTVGLSTKDLTTKQRLYLPLLLELAFKLPATLDDGTELSKDEFVSQLQDDTVSYTSRCGLSGASIPQMISFSVQMENPEGQGLAPALKWIRRVLYLTTFTTETVKMAAQKLLSEIPASIRHGPTICSAVSNELNYQPDESNKIASSPLRQWPFLDDLVKQMEEPDGAKEVMEDLTSVKRELTQRKNMQVFVAGNLKDVPDPMQTLSHALLPLGESEGSSSKGELISDVSALTVRSTDTGRAAICSLSAIESSFLSVTSQGVGAYDPNHAALLVAIEYLTALEGDFWVKLRGAGLTYGSSISNSTEAKLLKFGLFKCTDIGAAFAAASQILVEYASGQAKISDIGLESAKSSLAYNIISGVSTKLSAAIDAWIGNYVGKQVDYDQWLLSEIGKVTVDDAMHALVTYLIPLFDPSSNLAVTCPTNKVDEISKYFVERGWSDVEKVPEENLCKAFVKSLEEKRAPLNLPETKAGVSMFMPGAFAAQFQCSCIKCGREIAE